MYTIGDRPTFQREISGNPARVNALLKYPDGTVLVMGAVSMGSRYFATPPTLDQDSTHTLRWNVYRTTADTLPTSAGEEEFEVYPSAFPDPFLEA